MEVGDNLRPTAVAQTFALSPTDHFYHVTSADAFTTTLAHSLF